jgi:integrase
MKVTIENLKGRLRLRWNCPETGKRKNLALGVDESTTGRAYASTVKDRIESDVKHGYYDPTLLKYRSQKKRQQVTEITTVELFDRFTKYQQKHKQLRKASIDTRYKYLGRMLQKHLDIPVSDVDKAAIDRFTLACRKLKPDTAKQRIWLLKSAWDWGRDEFQLPKENPWDGVDKRFASVPVQSIPGFDKEEVTKIIQGFRNNRYYSCYTDYVVFRFSMATRPQEVRDLKWKHISSDFSSVWFCSNKTKQARTVNLDPSISDMLKARRDRLNPQSDDELVFTSPEGLPIDNRNFCRRAWKTVLSEVGVKYRRPYTTRKTSVRLSLEAGNFYLDVAAAAGHDPQTMHKYYGDAIQKGTPLISFE